MNTWNGKTKRNVHEWPPFQFSTPPLKSAKLRPPLSTLIPSSARGSIKLNHVDHVFVGERNCSPGPFDRPSRYHLSSLRPEYLLFRFHSGDKAEPGRKRSNRPFHVPPTLGQLFAASSRGVACLNASFVCTGREEEGRKGLHKKFESGVCAVRDCRKRKDGRKGERWLGGRGTCGPVAGDGRLMKLAPVLYEIVHVQSMYVHTCRFAVGNNDLGESGGRKIGRFKMVMEWGKELVKLDRSLFVGDLNRDSFAWKIFTII